MKIIAFTGMPFSGKSEAVEIAREMGIPVIRMGDMIWDETKSRGLQLNDKNVGTVADSMRKQHGMDIWARKTLEKIEQIERSNLIVIDGVRNIEEVETFKNQLGEDFLLIGVRVKDEIRYRRAMSRRRQDDSINLDLIKKRDKRELSWGLKEVIEHSDIIISNEGSLIDLKEKIKEILKKT